MLHVTVVPCSCSAGGRNESVVFRGTYLEQQAPVDLGAERTPTGYGSMLRQSFSGLTSRMSFGKYVLCGIRRIAAVALDDVSSP